MTDGSIFLCLSGSKRRLLVEGHVQARDGDRLIATFASLPAMDVGREVKLFAPSGDRFVEQPAVVSGVSGSIVAFDLAGPLTPAERRSTFRACVREKAVPVRAASENDCVLADVSVEGVGVLSATALPVGQCVDVAFEIGGQRVGGTFFVHTAKRCACGRTRFGLKVPTRKCETTRQLRDALGRMQSGVNQAA